MTDNLSSSIWVEKLAEHISRELPETTAKKFMTLLEHAVHTTDFDWKAIFHDYCIFLLRDICPTTKDPSLKAAINHIIHLHETRETNPKVWDDAAADAYAAAYAAAKNQAKKYAYAKIADHLLEKFNEKSS